MIFQFVYSRRFLLCSINFPLSKREGALKEKAKDFLVSRAYVPGKRQLKEKKWHCFNEYTPQPLGNNIFGGVAVTGTVTVRKDSWPQPVRWQIIHHQRKICLYCPAEDALQSKRSWERASYCDWDSEMNYNSFRNGDLLGNGLGVSMWAASGEDMRHWYVI